MPLSVTKVVLVERGQSIDGGEGSAARLRGCAGDPAVVIFSVSVS